MPLLVSLGWANSGLKHSQCVAAPRSGSQSTAAHSLEAAWTNIRCTTNSSDSLTFFMKTKSPSTFRHIFDLPWASCHESCGSLCSPKHPPSSHDQVLLHCHSTPGQLDHPRGTRRPEKASTEQQNHALKAMMVVLRRLTQRTRWAKKAP